MYSSLFDTHCHLDFSVFDSCRNDILQSCVSQQVDALLIPAVERQNWSCVLELCSISPRLYPALGLHPGFISRHAKLDVDHLAAAVAQALPTAIGEIGLDYWPGMGEPELQGWFFDAQLEVARSFGLPVILHVRKAHDQVLQRLRKLQLAKGGIVHAFSGSYQQAEQYVELGFKLGVGGALTYPRAKRLRRTMAGLPLEVLVLETDAPDMPLCGLQGQVNRPDYLPKVVEVLSELRAEPEDVVRHQLWLNSHHVLGLELNRG